MELDIKLLNSDLAEESYKLAKCWDKYNTWCVNRREDFSEFSLFCNMFGVFIDKELVGFGTIYYFPSFISEDKNHETRISCITNPKYRRMGIGTKLVNYLVRESSKMYDIEKVKVEILKSKKITYEKKL